MPPPPPELAQISRLLARLEAIGLTPIMVGGMALVVLGSRRVTQDLDFLISLPAASINDLAQVCYDAGFELASRLDEFGHIVRTIDNPRMAAMRIRLDQPESLFFLHPATQLRIDFLLDFPLPAADLLRNTRELTIRGHTFHIASTNDLLRLKKIAYRDRKFGADLQDIEFLQRLKRKEKKS